MSTSFLQGICGIDWSLVVELLIGVGAPLLGILLAARIGVANFFKQREHQLILDRYLVGAVDELGKDYETVSSAYMQNWATSLSFLAVYKDTGGEFDKARFLNSLVPTRSGKVHAAVHARLYAVTGTARFWQVFQEATAFYTEANSFMTTTLPAALTSTSPNLSSEELAQFVENTLLEFNDMHSGYTHIAAELECVAEVMVKNVIQLTELKSLPSLPGIADARHRIEERYGPEKVRKSSAS